MANPFDQFDTGAPAPAGPLPSPPKAPRDTTTYRTLTPEEAAARGLPAGKMYQESSEGKLDAVASDGATDKPSQVPATSEKDARGQVGQFVSLQTARDTFKDDFGGNPIGGLENMAQSYLDVGTPGQREWWAAFKSADNQIRNDLFGSALTAPEKAAYEATTVSPGMRPEIIRQNVSRRVEIIRGALARQRDFMIKNGYREEAVDAIFGPILAEQEALAAGAEQQREQPAEQPPALASAKASPETLSPRSGVGPLPGEGMDNGGGGRLQLTQGEIKTMDNPVLSGVRDEYRQRLARGDSAGDLIAWAQEAGVHPSAFPSISAQAAYRLKNPNVPIEQYDTSELDDMAVPLSNVEKGLNAVANSDTGAAMIAAGDAASGFNLDSIIGATGGNAERARLGMDAIAEAHPKSNLAGTIAGGTMTALGGESALGALGIAPGVGLSLGADALYGAFAGAGGTDYDSQGRPATVTDRFLGGAKGVGASLIGSGVGNAVSRTARGVKDASVQALSGSGVPLTVGQLFSQSGRVGAAVKSVEDRLAGIPVVGDMINARRTEGMEVFNSKAFDHALKPIEKVVGDKTGEEAVELAQQLVSDAYARALTGKIVRADQQFAQDLTASVTKVGSLARVGPEVMEEVQDILAPYMSGTTVSGEAMQAISRDLQNLKRAYRNDTRANAVGKAVDGVEDAVFGMFKRQAPEVLEDYRKAKAAYRRVSTLEDAVLAAKNSEGAFTPAQLGNADKAATRKFDGKRAAARGDGPFHDMQRDAQKVLPNKIPDSGTAGRIIMPLAGAGVIGGDAATGDGLSPGGLTLGAILSGAYTKAGQRLLGKSARGASSKAGKLIGSEPARKAISATAGSSAASLTTQ
jgi:hypothetical protein